MAQGDRYDEGYREGVQDTRLEWLRTQNDVIAGVLLGVLGFLATGFVTTLGAVIWFLFKRTEKVKKDESS